MTDIGGGWVEQFDANSGRNYYYNATSGDTSWDWPEAVPKPAAAAPAAAAAGGNGDWMEQVDPASGRTYYYNTVTNETSWTDPRTPAASGAADWAERVDDASGRTYYYNLKTGATTWEKPVELGGESKGAEEAGDGPQMHASGPVCPLSAKSKEIWKKVVDQAKLSATANITAKNNKFSKLRNFVRVKAREVHEDSKGAEAAAAEAVDDAANALAALAVIDDIDAPVKPVKPILSMLQVALPKTVEEMSLEEYAEAYFNLNRKGLFNKRTTVQKILAWKADVIRTSLRKMSSDLSGIAVQAFRNITGYMGDRNTKKETGGHAYKLLTNCLNAPEELRDEIYCQLIKQTYQNPSPESVKKGWELFAICSGAFPPSKEFEPYLMSYIFKHLDSPEVGVHAKFVMGRIIMAGSLPPRREIPTAIEVESARELNPVIVRVYLLDNTFHNMPVTSWTTPEHLNAMMALKLGLRNAEGFAVFEMNPEGEERLLEKDRILDIVAYWQRLFEEEKTKKQKKEEDVTNMYRFVYKTHMYFAPQPIDLGAVKLTFIQAVFDVTSGRYPCKDEDVVKLAALQLRYERGAIAGKMDLLLDRLSKFVPARLISDPKLGNPEVAAAVLREYQGHPADMTKRLAMDKYLDHVRQWKMYGSSFFFVETQASHVPLPDEVFLAVNPKGVLAIRPEDKEILADFGYDQLPTWGHSGSSFVLHIGDLVNQQKVFFLTQQGKEINDLVRAYVNHMVVA